MIIVDITLLPASGGEPRHLGRMVLTNDGAGTLKRGNYDVAVLRKGKLRLATAELDDRAVTRRGRVEDYPRKSYSVWRLVLRALRKCFPEDKA